MNVLQRYQKHAHNLYFKLRAICIVNNRFSRVLPIGFDKNLYLELNPDVKIAGVDAAQHYFLHGKSEGRLFRHPSMEIFDSIKFDGEKQTVLVVCHEASRTGAPILGLNLVQEFTKKYNIVVLLLGEGGLIPAFSHSGAQVVVATHARGNAAVANLFIEKLCKQNNFSFAVVNSIESGIVLPELSRKFIPTITLIHEFAAYTRPQEVFRNVLFWSTEVVFSANITRDNAFSEYPELAKRTSHVLPQGRCYLPPQEFFEDIKNADRKYLSALIRPKSASNAIVILGAGYIQYRKGVDLFIECATRILASQSASQYRFVWVGKGYDPINDISYAAYLADQIKRAGINEHLVFLDEMVEIEVAYEQADMLLLSSRLDPLPNVAIDSLSHGKPVVCFDKSTGIVDFLKYAKVDEYCVAEYINTDDMAKKIVALGNSRELLKKIGGQCKESSADYFNTQRYASEIISLAERGEKKVLQERLDVKEILDSELYRSDFSSQNSLKNESMETQVRVYVRSWAANIGQRKPFPGFNPSVYEEINSVGCQNEDPFANYIRAGMPSGSWRVKLIAPCAIRPAIQNIKIALHIHVYYVELLECMLERLKCNVVRPDLFISVKNQADKLLVEKILDRFGLDLKRIEIVPNRGRDIGPLLTAFGSEFVDMYEVFGHIHTKKSLSVDDTEFGHRWYIFLLENLLGGIGGGMIDSIISSMQLDSQIKLVFPDDPYILGWEKNKMYADELAEILKIQLPEKTFSFSVGNMFWAKTSKIRSLVSLGLGWEDYPSEPLPYDGTKLHAIERILPFLDNEGMESVAVTNVPGISR